jgi:hypothetical protein
MRTLTQCQSEPRVESRVSAIRRIFAAQARLLSERAERGFAIDARSIGNLFRAWWALLRAERAA